MKSLTVQEAQTQLLHLMDEIAQLHQPIAIIGQEKEAVLISKADWEAMQETLYLSSIPGMVESIHEAAREPIEDAIRVEDLDW